MIIQGTAQDLLLDPGSYTIDPDASSFNATVNNSTNLERKILFLCSLELDI